MPINCPHPERKDSTTCKLIRMIWASNAQEGEGFKLSQSQQFREQVRQVCGEIGVCPYMPDMKQVFQVEVTGIPFGWGCNAGLIRAGIEEAYRSNHCTEKTQIIKTLNVKVDQVGEGVQE